MGPFKCPDCGVWWAGLEHRCRPTVTLPGSSPVPGIVIRPYPGPMQSGGTSSTPWCSICQGWHIPGAGPCARTYSEARA